MAAAATAPTGGAFVATRGLTAREGRAKNETDNRQEQPPTASLPCGHGEPPCFRKSWEQHEQMRTLHRTTRCPASTFCQFFSAARKAGTDRFQAPVPAVSLGSTACAMPPALPPVKPATGYFLSSMGGGSLPYLARYLAANFSLSFGSQMKHCDLARSCLSHQSPLALASLATLS